MKKLFTLIVIVYLLAAGVLYVQSYSNPCSRQLVYTVGSYDPRFGITKDQFANLIQETEAVWESRVNRDLFRYDPNAKFRFNLVFDERQQKTLDERELRQKIDLTEESYDKLVGQYNNLTFQHKAGISAYDAAYADYQSRLKDYNAEVSEWNKKGGAPSEDYKRLNAEKQQLNTESRRLEQERLALNAEAQDINALADRINEIAQKLNLDVDDYNGKFGTSKRFDQGTYTGEAINIYQFNEEADLRLVIAHEFGHALRLEHVEDPKAIMYYLMEKQDLANLTATEADLQELSGRCGINYEKQ